MSAQVNAELVKQFNRFKFQSLCGIFIGYAAYYIVRNNFIFSTPYLMGELGLSKSEIGLLTSCMLITYGLSKGFMSMLADKSNPKYFMALGTRLCIMDKGQIIQIDTAEKILRHPKNEFVRRLFEMGGDIDE